MSIVELITVIAVSKPNRSGKCRLIMITSPVLVRVGTKRPDRLRQAFQARSLVPGAVYATMGRRSHLRPLQSAVPRPRETAFRGLCLCCCKQPAALQVLVLCRAG